jgi:Tfp pilus assembly protein PilF
VTRRLAVAVLLTCAVGCSRPAAVRVVTYNRDVAPVLYASCATCHRPVDDAPGLLRETRPTSDAPGLLRKTRPTSDAPGLLRETRPTSDADAGDDPICVAGAPFSVLDYASVRRHAPAIARAVKTRAMPPWLPEPGYGTFAHERRLTDEQIALIATWVAQGAPEGEPAAAPPLPASPGGWQLGTPDLVVTLPEPYVLQPGSRDTFRNFVIPVSVPATRYVRGVELRTDNPRVLHHANLAVDAGRVSRRLDRDEAGPGFASMSDDQVQNVYGWSPGKVPVLEPAETAWTLDPGADLVVQLHMVATPTTERVQPTIALYFADTAPTRTPIVVKLESKTIEIPAGAADYVVEDRYTLPADVDAVSIYPHAHKLAKEMRGTATLPDGRTLPLVWIRRWDIRWQDQYRYASPLFLPKGTTVAMHFTYDNSAGTQPVHWGPLSTDEMGALWLEVVPRRAEDAAVLAGDYFRRALLADTAAAELQVRTRPRDAAARNVLALKYLQATRVDEARAQLEDAIRIDAGDAEAHSNLGTLLQARGEIAAALEQLRTAARLKPDDDRVRFNLGNGLLAANQPDAAMREFERAIALNPEAADAHFNLAMLLGPRNRVDDAIAHLRRVVEIDPRNADAYRNLAIAYGLKGRLDDAQAARAQFERLRVAQNR